MKGQGRFMAADVTITVLTLVGEQRPQSLDMHAVVDLGEDRATWAHAIRVVEETGSVVGTDAIAVALFFDDGDARFFRDCLNLRDSLARVPLHAPGGEAA